MEYERKMNLISYLSLIIFIVAEFAYMYASGRITAQFQQGLITQEQMKIETDKINRFIPVFFMIYIIFIAISTTWLRVAQIKYERDQALLDMLQGPIQLSDSDRYEYLIKSKSDSVREIKIQKAFLQQIESSDAFNSILTSISTDIDGFNIDHAQVLKKLDKLEPSAKIKNEKSDNNKSDNENKKITKKLKEKVKNMLYETFDTDDNNNLQIEQLKSDLRNFFSDLKSKIKDENTKLRLYFRLISDIENIDYPEESSFFSKETDRLENVKAIFYLTLDTDRQFEKRLHPIEGIEIRKKYIDWVLAEFVTKNVAFFVDRSLIITKQQISDKSLEQSRVLALSYLTDLTIQKDSELRDEIANLRIELEDKKREISEKWDKIIERLIDTNELESKLRGKMAFRPINLTAAVLSVLSAVIGILIGLYVLGGGK